MDHCEGAVRNAKPSNDISTRVQGRLRRRGRDVRRCHSLDAEIQRSIWCKRGKGQAKDRQKIYVQFDQSKQGETNDRPSTHWPDAHLPINCPLSIAITPSPSLPQLPTQSFTILCLLTLPHYAQMHK